ncbi:hypothetical protein HDV62DRAFT_167604 [Trichoderma sp. SZMC 28011]
MPYLFLLMLVLLSPYSNCKQPNAPPYNLERHHQLVLSPRKHDVNSRIGTTWPLASHEQQGKNWGCLEAYQYTSNAMYALLFQKNRSSLPPCLRAYRDID